MSQCTSFASWPWSLTYDLDLRTWRIYPSTWLPCQNSRLYIFPRVTGALLYTGEIGFQLRDNLIWAVHHQNRPLTSGVGMLWLLGGRGHVMMACNDVSVNRRRLIMRLCLLSTHPLFPFFLYELTKILVHIFIWHCLSVKAVPEVKFNRDTPGIILANWPFFLRKAIRSWVKCLIC